MVIGQGFFVRLTGDGGRRRVVSGSPCRHGSGKIALMEFFDAAAALQGLTDLATMTAKVKGFWKGAVDIAQPVTKPFCGFAKQKVMVF